jgi:hypothetical protein
MPQHRNKKVSKKLREAGSTGRGSVSSLFFLVLTLIVVGSAMLYQQDIKDWLILRNYQPTTEIKQLADESMMSDSARRVFYVNDPELNKKTDFVSNCPDSKKEQTIVLGCYHSNQAGIFLLNVSDPRLNGVEQVTAAHEMLHAAYDRLSSSERQNVDAMLEDYYKNELADERIKSTIDAYRKSEPNDLTNEMHSIFGTEIQTLPSNLEDYYKRYFTSRKAVVALSAHYQAEFTSREEAVEKYDARLEVLKREIDAAKSNLQSRRSELDAKEAYLDGLKSSGNISAYNSQVYVINSMIDSYNSKIADTKALIDEFNQIVVARNALAVEQQELTEGLKGVDRAIAQ